MLRLLNVKNVVLIDDLTVEFESGLSVLTGETGAGKSILLDALGLALGARADKRLVRSGANKAVVTAVFDIDPASPVHQLLHALDIDFDQEIILRRSLAVDGKSKCFINDNPVALGALKSIGSQLIEIHGQFDRILDADTHLSILDQFSKNENLRTLTANAFDDYRSAKKRLNDAKAFIEQQKNQQEFLAFAVKEFAHLSPQIGEEEQLLEKRHSLKNLEKITETYQTLLTTIDGDEGVIDKIGRSMTLLERQANILGPRADQILEQLNQLQTLASETLSSIEEGASSSTQEESLEDIEDRLYDLRALARKHGCHPDDLVNLAEKFTNELALLENSEQTLGKLEDDLDATKQQFHEQAEKLRLNRKKNARILENKIESELAPLKLEKASFRITFSVKPESAWSRDGMDSILFEVRTNPGQVYGAIDKIASGGERSRFMLAAKVVLAKNSHASILIFDEIDSGVGGAVASAIGERMARLGREQQVLAITHSPQVAAHACAHFFVSKNQNTKQKITTTEIRLLSREDCIEEIARMLAGDQVSEAARLAAQQLKQSTVKKVS